MTGDVEQTGEHGRPHRAFLFPEGVADGQESSRVSPSQVGQVGLLDKRKRHRLVHPEPYQCRSEAPCPLLLERQATTGAGRKGCAELLVAVEPRHFLDQICRSGHIGPEGRHGDHHRVGSVDRHAQTGQDAAHLIGCEPRPQQTLDIRQRQIDLDRLSFDSDLIDHFLEHAATAELHHHRRRPSIGLVGEIGVHPTLESGRCFRHQPVTTRHVHDRGRVPGGRLHEDVHG